MGLPMKGISTNKFKDDSVITLELNQAPKNCFVKGGQFGIKCFCFSLFVVVVVVVSFAAEARLNNLEFSRSREDVGILYSDNI